MTQEDVKHFNLARKYKINQQILDGFLDPAEAISAPSVFVCIIISCNIFNVLNMIVKFGYFFIQNTHF